MTGDIEDEKIALWSKRHVVIEFPDRKLAPRVPHKTEVMKRGAADPKVDSRILGIVEGIRRRGLDRLHVVDDSCGITNHDSVRGHGAGHYGTRSHHRTRTNLKARENCSIRPNRGAPAHNRTEEPLRTIFAAGEPIVGEGRIWSDKNVVL